VRRSLLVLPLVLMVSVYAAAGCAGDDPSAAEPVDPEVAAEVVTAAMESWRLLNAARLDPSDSAATDAALAAYFGPAREQATDALTAYRLNDQRSVTDDAVPATVVPYPDTVVVDEAANEASVEYCQVDTNTIVRASTGEVLDDEPDSYRIRVRMVRVDGRWLEADGDLLDTFDGATTCPDLP
jgi:hypothetical protein